MPKIIYQNSPNGVSAMAIFTNQPNIFADHTFSLTTDRQTHKVLLGHPFGLCTIFLRLFLYPNETQITIKVYKPLYCILVFFEAI